MPMSSKKFEFDFNENAEPVAELHRMRATMAEHFKTPEALFAYYRSLPQTSEGWRAELDARKKTARGKTGKQGRIHAEV